MILLHLGLGINLSPSVKQEPDHDHIPPPGCNVQRCDTILQRETEALRQAQNKKKDGAKMEINLPTSLVIPYLWGEVDIGSSIEQQLSYVQVFIVCSNVEGCESSLQGHIRGENMSLSLNVLFRKKGHQTHLLYM